jgi:hypothetical protein
MAGNGASRVTPCVVDEDPDGHRVGQDRLHRARRSVAVCHVEAHGLGGAARGADLRAHGLGGVGVAVVVDDHGVTERRERARDGRADPAAAAGDERTGAADAAVMVCHGSKPSRPP